MEKRTFTRLGLSLAAMALAVLGTQVAVISIAKIAFPSVIQSTWFNISTVGIFYVVGVPVFWLLTRSIPAYTVTANPERMSAGRFLMFFVMSMGATYVLNLVGTGLTFVLTRFTGGSTINALADMLDGTNLIFTVAFAVILSPIFEELVFRKLLLDRLRPFGDKTAIIFSGIAFGLFHMNLTQFFYAVMIGFILAYIAIRTGKLIYPILLHMCINAIGTIGGGVLLSDTSRILPVLIGVSLMAAFVIIGGTLLLVKWKSCRLDPAPYSFSCPLTVRMKYFNVGMLLYIAVCATMFVLALF